MYKFYGGGYGEVEKFYVKIREKTGIFPAVRW